MPREVISANPVEVTEAEIANMVKEEIAVIADKIIREEVEKEIEEKISGKKISVSRRMKIFQKVNEDVRKQVPELLEKIAKEQMKSTDKEEDEEHRVSREIRAEITEKIQSIVHRSMEKAIADEIFERVKIDKLSRTPTVEPKLGIGVRHAQVLMVFFFLAISYLQRSDLSVAIVAMTNRRQANVYFQEFNWDEPTIGLLLSSFYWGYFILQIPGGIIAEKFSPKSVMAYSMIFCSMVCICMPAATILGGWVGLYIMKVVLGIGQCTFIPAVYVFVARWIPPNEKSKLFTPAFGGMQMGTVVGLPIAGLLCSSPVGWPAVFFFSGLVGFLWALVWIFIAANSPAVHRSISREEQLYIEGSFGFGEITIKGAKKTIPWKPILTSIPFWALMLAHFGQNWGFFTLFTKMPAFIGSVLHVDIAENSFLNALSFLIGWILIVIFGFLSSSIHEKNLVQLETERKIWNSIAFYGGGLAFFAIGFTRTTSLSTVMLLMTIVLSTNSAVYNGLFSNHADLSPNYVGILMALSNCLGNLAALCAPIFVAEVVRDPSSVHQWAVVFHTAGGVMFVSNTIFVIFGSSEIQSWNTPSDLHLQLHDDIPPTGAGLSMRKNQQLFVSNVDLSEVASSPTPRKKKHRRSI